MDDKNKKELGYSADIQYEEDYTSDYSGLRQTSIGLSDPQLGPVYDNDFMDIINDDIKKLIHLVPGLPIKMQTAINQVLKPTIRAWKKIRDNDYPIRIPDGGPIIWYPDPKPIPIPGPPEPTPVPPPEPFDPIFRPPTEEYNPVIITPEIYDPTPTPRPVEIPDITSTPFISDDDLFTPSTDRKIIYEPIDEIEQMEMEYTKNLADLIHHYTSQLLDKVAGYFTYKLSAISTAKDDYDFAFLFNEITSETCSTQEGFRHIMDSALRNEITSSNKLEFSINTFTLEGTLYHFKNYNSIQEMRLRYAQIDKFENNTLIDSTANKILNGNKSMYDKKYDLAYTNLYKYLNGSLQIIDDCFKTVETNLKSKEILIGKDGLNKDDIGTNRR